MCFDQKPVSHPIAGSCLCPLSLSTLVPKFGGPGTSASTPLAGSKGSKASPWFGRKVTSCNTKPGVIERQLGMEGRVLGLGCPGIFHPLRAALGTSSHAFAGSSKLHCSVSSSLNTTSGRIPFPAALGAQGLWPRCGPKLKPCSSSQLCLSEQGYSSSIGSPSLLLQGWGHQGPALSTPAPPRPRRPPSAELLWRVK